MGFSFILALNNNIKILLHSCKPSPVIGTGGPKLFKAVVDFCQRMFHDDKVIVFLTNCIHTDVFPPPKIKGNINRIFFALLFIKCISFIHDDLLTPLNHSIA